METINASVQYVTEPEEKLVENIEANENSSTGLLTEGLTSEDPVLDQGSDIGCETSLESDTGLSEESVDSAEEESAVSETSDEPDTPDETVKAKYSAFKTMLEIFQAYNPLVFKDGQGQLYTYIMVDGKWVTLSLRSEEFYSTCLKIYYDAKGESIGRETVSRIAAYLGNTKTIIPLYNRFVQQQDSIYIDLRNDSGEVVEITAEKYSVIVPDYPLFYCYSHQKPLPKPTRDGKVEDILNFLPVTEKDSQLLIMVWLCSIALADIPRPGIILYGSHGSAKTSFAEFLRGVIDPSSIPTMSMPSSPADFAQQMDHHAIFCLDNLDRLTQPQSDSLCRAVTGSGFTKRTLFTDDSDFSFQFKRTFILNGINVAATSPDLLDRSILIELDRIPEDKRIQISELNREFKKSVSSIFGAICATLSKAMAIKNSTPTPNRLTRMADWYVWGRCITEALGYDPEDFYRAYTENQTQQNSEVVSFEPVCQAVMLLVDKTSEKHWEGSPSELYTRVTNLASDNKFKDESWPRAANSLIKKLNIFRYNLEKLGYSYNRSKRGGDKKIYLTRHDSIQSCMS